MSDGYRHYAGLYGSNVKTVGADKNIYQYTDFEAALAAAVPNDIIILDTGTYSLTETATINYNLTVIGRGRVTINGGTLGIEDRLFMLNKPASGTAATYIEFRNIHFVNAYAAADIFEIDNDGGATGTFYQKFIDCSFYSNAGVSFDLDQTTNTIAEHLYVKGQLAVDMPIDGMNLALSMAASTVHIEGYDFGAEVIALGTANVASVYTLMNCQYESAAMTTGGAASIIFNAQGCMKVSSGAIVAPVIEDFDATAASENIQSGVLDT